MVGWIVPVSNKLSIIYLNNNIHLILGMSEDDRDNPMDLLSFMMMTLN
jgi:hypothetical protein